MPPRAPAGMPRPRPSYTGTSPAAGYGGSAASGQHPQVPYRNDPYTDTGEIYRDVYSDAAGGGMLYTDVTYGDAYSEDPVDEDPASNGDEELPRRGRSRLLLALVAVLGVLLVLVVLVGLWANRQINPSGAEGETVTVELLSGQSTAEIAQVLENEGVITDARVFTAYARFRSRGDIHAGVYELRTNMAMPDVLDALDDGPIWNDTMTTIREGLSIDQTIAHLSDPENGGRFDEDKLRQALEEGQVTSQHFDVEEIGTLEGMLYPSTYGVDEDTDEVSFLQTMVDEFDSVYGDLDVEARASDVGLSSGYEVLTVASMVEKEARIDEDRAKIARVIYNRLEAGRPLQIDATSCYDKEGKCFPLSDEDLRGPYSTRHEPGLPPTPISSPGRASIEAALEPAEGDWLYYVLDVEADDGSHFFTADDQEWEPYRQRCEDAGLCG